MIRTSQCRSPITVSCLQRMFQSQSRIVNAANPIVTPHKLARVCRCTPIECTPIHEYHDECNHNSRLTHLLNHECTTRSKQHRQLQAPSHIRTTSSWTTHPRLCFTNHENPPKCRFSHLASSTVHPRNSFVIVAMPHPAAIMQYARPKLNRSAVELYDLLI